MLYKSKTIPSFILLIQMAFSCIAIASEESQVLRETDDIDLFLKQQNYSGSILLVKRGQLVYESGLGFANISNAELNTPKHVFRIGSLTKDFTVFAVLLLAKEGKIKSYADRVSLYVDNPLLPEGLTIADLVLHRTGLPDILSLIDLKVSYEKEALIQRILSAPRGFLPGEKREYSNSNFILLGYLIEVISGDTYWNYIQKYIFNPLGMESTYVFEESLNGSLVKSLNSVGYVENTSSGLTYTKADHMDMSIPYAAGAYSSDLTDLKRWIENLLGETLLSSSSIRKLFSSEFGFDWEESVQDGTKIYSHAGGIFGFSSFIAVLPAENSYIILLSNIQDRYESNKSISMNLLGR